MKLAWIAIRVGLYMVYMLIDFYRVKYYLKRGDIAKKDKIIDKVCYNWSHYVVNCTKSRVEVIGQENLPPSDEPLLVVANHQSAFDIPLLAGYLGRTMGYVSKKENQKIPLLGAWLKYTNSVFIDRGNPRAAIKTIHEGAAILKSGYTQGLFPEGTRSDDGTMAAFKAGGFKLAEKSGVRILPVTIVGANLLMPKGTFKINKQDIKLVVSPPIDVSGLSTNDMAKYTHDIIEAQLKKYQALT